MRYLTRILLPAAIVLLAAACAKNPSEDTYAKEKAALSAWIRQNAPDAVPLGDIYMEHYPADIPGAQQVLDGDWVRVDVIGRNLEGGIFYNSSDVVLAKRLGAFTRWTHYVAKQGLVAFNSELSNGLTVGQLNALLQMREGDSCRIYVPSRLAYSGSGTATSNGYQGNVQLGANRPAIFEMRLVEVIKNDIQDHEQDLVRQRAQEWGVNLADTVRRDLIYLQHLDIIPQDPADNTGTSITVDSIFYYYYTMRFLDDFVISTNVDSVATQAWGTSNSTTNIPVLFDKSYDNVSQVLLQVAEFGNISFGQVFRIVYTSRYGFGSTGYPGDSDTPSEPYTVIQPYTPLVMEVYVLPINRTGE